MSYSLNPLCEGVARLIEGRDGDGRGYGVMRGGGGEEGRERELRGEGAVTVGRWTYLTFGVTKLNECVF